MATKKRRTARRSHVGELLHTDDDPPKRPRPRKPNGGGA
jgi:hypothetical protein